MGSELVAGPKGRIRSGRRPFVEVAVALICLAPGAQAADPVFDAGGFTKNRDFFSQLPYEHIDPMTGNLLLTFTDVVLPGSAGFDLAIQRTYNSKALYADYNTSNALGEDSWAGAGWILHLGRVIDPGAGQKPISEMPDGSRHPTFSKNITGGGYGGTYFTRDYWIYDTSVPNAPVLLLPNGCSGIRHCSKPLRWSQ